MKKIKIKEKTIYNLKPLRTNFININGNFSAVGFIGKKKVKIYSPVEKSQIDLRVQISKSKISEYFPKLIIYNKKLIVEEWISGKTLKELKYTSKRKRIFFEKKIRDIIYELKKFKYKKKNYVFDYISYIY